MEDLPQSAGEWMRQVNRRLTRLERRIPAAAPAIARSALLVRTSDVPAGWEPVDDLDAPPGWVYVARPRQPEPDPEES